MARAREFDEDQAVHRALQVFWHRGYKAASLNELLNSMELSKSSVYDTFGSKRQLLMAALRRYTDAMMEGPAAALMRPGAGRAAIEETFATIATHALSPDGRRGCFVNNCLTEIAPHDSVVLKATRAAMLRLEDALAGAVRQGQDDGTISRREDPRALARFLVNTLSGINLAAKAKPDKARLDDIVRVALRALD